MDINYWTQYGAFAERVVVQHLIQEEIDRQCRHREQVNFACVSKKRIMASIFWSIPTLALLVRYIVMNPLDRDPLGVLPVVAAALIWVLRVCRIGNQNVVEYLTREASQSPDKPFSQIVADNIQTKEQALPGSRKIHVLLCLAVMLGALMIPVADRLSEMRVDGMIFKSYQHGCILVDCVRDFDTDHVVIPVQVEGKDVIAIDSGAFMDEQDIVSVSIPNTVESIGAEAFSGCRRLESIVIPRKVTEIRGNCFENCSSLKNVVLHDGITSIRGYAFRNCTALEEITLPRGITEIRGNCFEYCISLKSIEIPYGVTRIGGHAFADCRALESVIVPDTVWEIGSSAFRRCQSLMSIEISMHTMVNERAFKESPTIITYNKE